MGAQHLTTPPKGSAQTPPSPHTPTARYDKCETHLPGKTWGLQHPQGGWGQLNHLCPLAQVVKLCWRHDSSNLLAAILEKGGRWDTLEALILLYFIDIFCDNKPLAIIQIKKVAPPVSY